jgi:sec-independent protein translocase protein TatA
MNFGPTELIIILVIVVVLFGVGRISKIAGEMGSGIKAFKDGIQGQDEMKDKTEQKETDQKETDQAEKS